MVDIMAKTLLSARSRNGNGRNGHARNGNGSSKNGNGHGRNGNGSGKNGNGRISWAASNGDRSENGDYIYGKKRLREIDRRIHYLNKRLDSAEVVDPAKRGESDQIYFGATVTYAYVRGGKDERIVTIVGVDEVDTKRGQVSWLSPIARALLKRRSGDIVTLATPSGEAEIEIIGVRYRATA
jgi:transcription elongation factor GreB